MSDIIDILVGELTALLAPLLRITDSDYELHQLFAAVGVEIDALDGIDPATFRTSAADLLEALTSLDISAPQLSDLPAALAAIADLVSAGRTVTGVADGDALPAELRQLWPQVGEQLTRYLVATWIKDFHPWVYRVLEVLGVITVHPEIHPSPIVTPSGQPVYLPTPVPYFDATFLLGLVRDPRAVMNQSVFGSPQAPTGRVAIDAIVATWWPRIEAVADLVALPFLRADDPTLGASLDDLQSQVAHSTITVPLTVGPVRSTFTASMSVADVPTQPSWIMLTSDVAIAADATVGGWTVTGSIDGGPTATAIVLDSHGETQLDGPHPLEVRARLTSPVGTGGPAITVGASTGTRLQVDTVTLRVGAIFTEQAEIGVELDLIGLALVADFGDGDGFLQHLAQAVLGGPLRVTADVTAGWAWHSGVFVRASVNPSAVPSYSVDIPVSVDIGPVHVPALHLTLTPVAGASETLAIDATADIRLDLAVLGVTVSHVGVRIDLAADDHGNLGPLDATLGFRPPSGAGLALDTPVVSGGGFVEFDPARGRYSGGLQLAVADLSLTALGLITTSSGPHTPHFTLLVVITATLPPIQIGLGFTLTGIGGLLAYNRTVNVDALRAGVRTGGLDAVLFPKDAIKQADALINRLDGLFPIAAGRIVLGPMVRIEWGTPAALLVADIAVLVEVPAPVRAILLGRIRVGLPDVESASVIDLKLDVLGVLDLGQGQLSLDATLYDSRIGAFAVSGDMALRLGWGATPQFAMSLGGWHPAFTPPAGMPTLRRMTIAVSSGTNPVLRMEAYLAITTNTIQFGAHAELSASAGPVSIAGSIGFDVLLHLSPFGLLADFDATVAFRFDGVTLLGVSIRGTLSGPSPWHVTGQASVTLLFVTVTISFDATIGSRVPVTAPPAVRVLDRVTTAMSAPSAWTTTAPAGDALVVLLPKVDPSARSAHPLAVLSVTQPVAPLGVRLDQFGTAAVAGPTTIGVVGLLVGGVDVRATMHSLDGEFTPAQFRHLTDAEALSQPAFAAGQAGFTVAAPHDLDVLGASDAASLAYNVVLDDPLGVDPATLPVPPPAPAPPETRSTATSPAAGSAARTTGRRAWASRQRYDITVRPQSRFTDLGLAADDGTDVARGAGAASRTVPQ